MINFTSISNYSVQKPTFQQAGHTNTRFGLRPEDQYYIQDAAIVISLLGGITAFFIWAAKQLSEKMVSR